MLIGHGGIFFAVIMSFYEALPYHLALSWLFEIKYLKQKSDGLSVLSFALLLVCTKLVQQCHSLEQLIGVHYTLLETTSMQSGMLGTLSRPMFGDKTCPHHRETPHTYI